MFLEVALLIFCRNNFAFSVWFSFTKLSAQSSVALRICCINSSVVLTFEQRTALSEISQCTENKVCFYDKGNGFVILNKKDAIQKIEEQVREFVVSNTEPISALTSKIRKHLASLRKQQKFDTRTYFQHYLSNPFPPRLYGVIKANKPENVIPYKL